MLNKKLVSILFLLLFLGSVLLMGVCQADNNDKVEAESLVSIMFFETDLREALKELSMQTGVTIIADETVHGFVTAEFEDVSLEKVLKVILIGGGYSFRKIDDFYLVGLADPNNVSFGELSQVEVIQLKNRSVKYVMELLPAFLENYVEGNPREDILTVSAPPKELKRIKSFIEKIDQPQQQVEVKVLVTEISSSEIKELGINLFNYDNSKDANKSLSYNTDNNLLVLEGDYYGKLLTRLKILEEKEKAKIEANPRVMLADGEEAKLFVGKEQTLFISPNHEEDYYKSWTEEIRVGVGLDVKVKIIGDEQIRLDIAPEISHFLDQSSSDLIVRESAVSTTLRVKNGQTVLLAGMTLKEDSNYQDKVPVLGDIPLLRWMFRNESQSKADKELLLFVTPVIKD